MTHDAYISYLAPKILHVCSCRLIGGSSALTALPQLFLSSPDKYLKNKFFAVLPISISYLTGDKYSFPNVSTLDTLYKNTSKSIYLTDISLRQDEFFTSSHAFVPAYLHDSLRVHPSASVLSKKHPKVSLMIPDNSKAKTVRISVAPSQEAEVSILVNGLSYHLPSQFVQKWEYIEHPIDTTTKSLSIELDFDNCSSQSVVALIGSVSLFE